MDCRSFLAEGPDLYRAVAEHVLGWLPPPPETDGFWGSEVHGPVHDDDLPGVFERLDAVREVLEAMRHPKPGYPIRWLGVAEYQYGFAARFRNPDSRKEPPAVMGRTLEEAIFKAALAARRMDAERGPA